MKPPFQFLIIILDMAFGCKSNDQEVGTNPEVDCGTTEGSHLTPWYVYVKTDIVDGVVPKECSAVLVPVKDNKHQSDILLTTCSCIVDEAYKAKLTLYKGYDAHLVQFEDSNIKFQAYAGLRHKDDVAGVIPVEIATIFCHRRSQMELKTGLHSDDIAILKTVSPMPFDKKARPICRLEGLQTPKECVITSFGQVSAELRNRPVTVLSSDECRENANEKYSDEHDEKMVCAKVNKGAGIEDHALGTSVASLDKASQKWNLFGLVWFIEKSAPPSILSTRVSYYYDWIENLANHVTAVV